MFKSAYQRMRVWFEVNFVWLGYLHQVSFNQGLCRGSEIKPLLKLGVLLFEHKICF